MISIEIWNVQRSDIIIANYSLFVYKHIKLLHPLGLKECVISRNDGFSIFSWHVLAILR